MANSIALRQRQYSGRAMRNQEPVMSSNSSREEFYMSGTGELI